MMDHNLPYTDVEVNNIRFECTYSKKLICSTTIFIISLIILIILICHPSLQNKCDKGICYYNGTLNSCQITILSISCTYSENCCEFSRTCPIEYSYYDTCFVSKYRKCPSDHCPSKTIIQQIVIIVLIMICSISLAFAVKVI